MKYSRLFLFAFLLPALQVVQAQTSYEAAALLDGDLGGTARYVGMGGAMSALGADMSTMATNPAGTALYRSWDAALSLGGNWATQGTQSNLGHGRAFNVYGSFDNAGVVIANKRSNDGVLRFVNFGFNYRNVKRFGGKMVMGSNLNGLSQTGQMAWQAYQAYQNMDVRYEDFDLSNPDGFFQRNYYDDSWVGWLTLMGAQGYLIDANALDEKLALTGKNYYPSYYNNYTETLSGGIDAYDFNLSFNFFDALYLGATLTKYTVNHKSESVYTEKFEDGDYTLQNDYRTKGSGYDFKVGVIVRPFSESSFRMGLSATTPTWYTLRDYNSAILRTEVSLTDGTEDWTEVTTIDTQSSDAFGGDCYTDYTMIAPFKVNASLGGTIGSFWALGAEYEYTDYGKAMLYDKFGNENTGMNEHTTEYFTAKHTVRLGVEKTFGSFYTRLGYNYQTGGYKQNAWKLIPLNSVQTNTAFSNIKSTQNCTCGVGFRGDAFYIDAAVLYSTQKAEFYPFDDPNLEATPLNRSLVKGMLTVGMRF